MCDHYSHRRSSTHAAPSTSPLLLHNLSDIPQSDRALSCRSQHHFCMCSGRFPGAPLLRFHTLIPSYNSWNPSTDHFYPDFHTPFSPSSVLISPPQGTLFSMQASTHPLPPPHHSRGEEKTLQRRGSYDFSYALE